MSDRGFGIAGLLIAGAYYGLARGLPVSDLADVVGPAGLPTLYAWALGALSLVLVGRSSTGSFVPASPSDQNLPNRRTAAVLTLAAGGAYVVALPSLGYLASITLLIVATAYAYGSRVSGRTLAVGASGALALWLLFVWLLGIPQPAGLWPSLLGLA